MVITVQYKLNDLDKAILKLIKERDCTRAELVELTGMPRTTIHDRIDRMILKCGIEIKKYSVNDGHRGRPKVYYHYEGEIPDE